MPRCPSAFKPSIHYMCISARFLALEIDGLSNDLITAFSIKRPDIKIWKLTLKQVRDMRANGMAIIENSETVKVFYAFNFIGK